jgi:hypothetical protein
MLNDKQALLGECGFQAFGSQGNFCVPLIVQRISRPFRIFSPAAGVGKIKKISGDPAMSTCTSNEVSLSNDGRTEATQPGSGMHRPGHGVLDTEETACLDEVMHEAALRDSALRTPR